MPCPDCDGSGMLVCHACKGMGIVWGTVQKCSRCAGRCKIECYKCEHGLW